ncbi:MAG TPA: transporter substrate-binding domain-containing protein [Solirubrobacteraceae bacterium]|nr:transporter substrate-binding domain-containing protein [Solirubrobacteraceae bacterium]
MKHIQQSLLRTVGIPRRGRVAVGVAIAIVAALVIAACGGSSSGSDGGSGGGGSANANAKVPFKLVTPGTLTVAASATPPDFIVSATGGVSGIVPDILTRFADKYGLKTKYDIYSFSAALTAVEGGRADVGGAIYYTTQRAKALLYTSPYAHDGSYMVLPKSADYTGPSWLQGKTVGVAAGYAQVPYIQKALGSNHVLQFSNDQTGVEAVKTGRTVAYVTGGEVTYYTRGDSSLKYVTFKTGQLDQPASVTTQTDNMFVKCGNSALAKAIDDEMQTLRKNGQMKQIFAKYNESSTYYAQKLVRKSLCTS